MIDPRQQFRVLYRDFVLRLIDLELLSAGGEMTRLLVQFVALLGAFSFVLAIYLVPPFALSSLPPEKLALAGTGVQEFLIATTMVIVGMFAVIAWDSIFPDRRDAAILGILPLRTRTMFEAKVAAISTGLGTSVIAVNIATGLTLPFVVAPPGSTAFGFVRSFAAYWITMASAGTFVFCSLLAVQGLAAWMLSYRLFLRVSNLLQIAAFVLILGGYFVTPGSSELQVTAPESQRILAWFPSYWFLGLFQELNGPIHSVFGPLAARAVRGLGIALTIAATTYALAYLRGIRGIMEHSDIVPADRSHPASQRIAALISKIAPRPVERAVVLFIARTLSRSRQHRTILAAWCGMGLAISLTYAKILLYGNSQVYAPVRAQIHVPRWYEPNVPLMTAAFVMMILGILGTRAVYSIPATLKANWIFRITAVHSPGTYFIAVRKALYLFAAIPIWITAAILYLSIWPAPPVLAHLALAGLAGIIVVERSLYQFQKMPFACSYLPGKSDLKRRLAIYGTLFLLATNIGTHIEYWAMQSHSRYLVLLAILLTLAFYARKRWAAFASVPDQRLQFEDLEILEVAPLDFRRDGAWGMERYIDAADPENDKPWRVRIRSATRKTALACLIVAAIGALYEQYGRWQHRRHFPQIGTSVDIGGRSLNISCSGAGGPAVIFESGAGGPGYGWVPIQREIAKFARACWYDRAGYGWSDAAPYPHPSSAIAIDLHKLLHRAGIAPPYVLVGASFGGFAVRVYNGLFPEDVAGMVLADSSYIDEHEAIRVPSQAFLHAQSLFAKVLQQIGVTRVLMDDDSAAPPKGFTAREWEIASSFEPRTLTENAKESFLVSAKEARASGGLGDRPLIVLTAGLPSHEASNPPEARMAAAHQQHWIEIQTQLAILSSRGMQVVVPHSHHGIQFEAPEAIVAAVREVVMAVRQSRERH